VLKLKAEGWRLKGAAREAAGRRRRERRLKAEGWRLKHEARAAVGRRRGPLLERELDVAGAEEPAQGPVLKPWMKQAPAAEEWPVLKPKAEGWRRGKRRPKAEGWRLKEEAAGRRRGPWPERELAEEGAEEPAQAGLTAVVVAEEAEGGGSCRRRFLRWGELAGEAVELARDVEYRAHQIKREVEHQEAEVGEYR
jgi:hypothetical protein